MERNMLFAAVGAAVAVLASSCGGARTMNVDELAGRWQITSVGGDAVKMSAADSEAPYLGFDVVNGRLSGNAGCNNIMGGFTTGKPAGEISFGDIASTRMMCPDMAVEQKVMQALGKVAGYKSAGNGKAVLTGSDGAALLAIKKMKADIEAKDLAGTWRIKELAGKELVPASDAVYEITFDVPQRMFSCATGCNTLGGSFSSGYTDFRFDLSLSTMMMCPDISVEDSLKEVLPTVVSFGRLAGGGIGFYNGSNDLVLVLVK